MSWTAPRRFWSEVAVDAAEGGEGWTVRLDARPISTPARKPLAVPSRALADAIAAEWDAQTETIRPQDMPLTKAANVAIDRVTLRREPVLDMLAEYGATDLICYRAASPEGLVARQAAAWDPWVDWADAALNAPLILAQGVMHVAQPAPSLARLRAALAQSDAFALAGMHDLIALSGSLVLALAVRDGALEAGAAWDASRVDEIWQAEQWGLDDEAAAASAEKRAAFENAARLLRLLGGRR